MVLSFLSIIDIKTPSTLYSNDLNVRKGPKEGTAEKEARAGEGHWSKMELMNHQPSLLSFSFSPPTFLDPLF